MLPPHPLNIYFKPQLLFFPFSVSRVRYFISNIISVLFSSSRERELFSLTVLPWATRLVSMEILFVVFRTLWFGGNALFNSMYRRISSVFSCKFQFVYFGVGWWWDIRRLAELGQYPENEGTGLAAPRQGVCDGTNNWKQTVQKLIPVINVRLNISVDFFLFFPPHVIPSHPLSFIFYFFPLRVIV